MERILLTTDFSNDAKRAFEQTQRLAERLGMGITLVHVVIDLRTAPQGALLAPALSSPELGDEMTEAKEKLTAMAAEMGSGGVDVKFEVLAGESAAKSIAEYAKDNDVGMVAISTHGRTGLRHLILGSVAEEVVRHSPVPVVTFPPQ